jgi:WD40 repeat protein
VSNILQPKAPAANTPKELGKPFNPGVQINRLRFSLDGKWLAAACFDGKVRRWDMTTQEPTEHAALSGHNGWVSALVFSKSALFSVDSWGRLIAWESALKEPKQLWSVGDAHNGWVRDVALSRDSSRLATCGKDGFVRFWNPANGQKTAEFDAKADVLSLSFSPDNNSILAGDLFGMVRAFAIPSGRVAHTFEIKELHKLDRIQDVGGVKCLLVSGDGKTLFAAGGEPKTGGFVQAIPLLVAFDLATGKRRGQYKGTNENEGYVTDLSWHSAGYVIGTTSGQPGQGKLFCWQSGEAKPFFLGGKLPNCHSVALHPNGDRLAVSGTNTNSSGNGRVKGAGGDYPANSSPIQVWSVPKS